MKFLIFLIFIFLSFSTASCITIDIDANNAGDIRYVPTWKSLDSRPLPQWYDDAKIGIFIHFGMFSVPSTISNGAWFVWKWHLGQKPYVDFMKKNYRPDFTYADFGPQLTMEFFDADQWVNLFKKAGAKYAVLTARHGDGFSLWNTKYNFNWNSLDVGPKRDVVGEYVQAMRRGGLRVGLYHCFYEWMNKLFWEDMQSNFTKREFPRKSIAEKIELIENYEPDLLWSDCSTWSPTDGSHIPVGPPPEDYWRSRDFLTWLYNDSPVKDKVVVNDRWCTGCPGKHGGFFNHADKFMPNHLLQHKWESAMTIDRLAWQHRREATLKDFLSSKELISTMIKVVAFGGNILIDVGPTKEGTIPVIMEERLTQLGDWLRINGEAIYGSKPWTSQIDTKTPTVFYTAPKEGDAIYAIFLEWPANGELVLSSVKPQSSGAKIGLLGTSAPVSWSHTSNETAIHLPSLAQVQNVKDAWTLKLIGFAEQG